MERQFEADKTTNESNVLSTGTQDLCAFTNPQSKPLEILRGVVALRDDRRICFAPYQAPERLNLVLILKRRNPWEYIKKDILRSWCHLHRLSICFFVLVMSILVFFNQAIADQQTPRIH